jgi:hypothetical protein
MDRSLMDALMACTVALSRAHKAARLARRADICERIRMAEWELAAAIANLVPDSADEVAS